MEERPSTSNWLKSDWMLIYLLALVKLTIHLLTNTNYELHRDEYLYLAFADHLAWGYFSNGPAIGIFAFIIQIISGTSVFAVRLIPTLLGVVTVGAVGVLVKELGGKKWAIILAGAAVILSPAYLRVNWLFQPVSLDLLFWLLGTFFILKLVRTDNSKYWLVLGMIWGLGMLNKYSMVFLAWGFFMAIICTEKRKLILSKYFAYHFLIAFIIILPNLIWQYDHNWPVIFHMQNLQRTQLVNVQMTDFLLAQPLMILPATPVWICGLIYLLVNRETKSLRTLAFTFAFVLLTLMLLHGKAYYTLGIYFVLIAAGGVFLEKITAARHILIRPALLILMILVVLPGLPFSLPVYSLDKMVPYGKGAKQFGLEQFLYWEDGQPHSLPQDYADMTGWTELAGLTISIYQNLDTTEKKECVIYGENYGQAGAVKYFGKKSGLPEPISFSDNFLFWAPDTLTARIVIYINDDTSGVSAYFGQVQEMGRITNPYARESGLPVYLCRYPRADFERFYRGNVRKLKSTFDRTLSE
jgi:hypothetical protein